MGLLVYGAGSIVNSYESTIHRCAPFFPIDRKGRAARSSCLVELARCSQWKLVMELRDLSTVCLRSENEIDNAIYAILCAAFCEEGEGLRKGVRRRLGSAPRPLEILDAVCDELRDRGLLRYEEQRRMHAAHVIAAFLDLPESEREDVSLMAVA
jgi:hypothetical protein